MHDIGTVQLWFMVARMADDMGIFQELITLTTLVIGGIYYGARS